MALVGAVAVVAGLPVAVSSVARSSTEPVRPPPFAPGVLSGFDRAGDRVRLAPGARRAILYVDERCPFCAVELRAWARVLGARDPPPGVTVVLSPTSGVDDLSYLPETFRRAWIHDRDGGLGRALGVRVVPFLAEVDARGVVESVAAGVSGTAHIEDVIAKLHTKEGSSHER